MEEVKVGAGARAKLGRVFFACRVGKGLVMAYYVGFLLVKVCSP